MSDINKKGPLLAFGYGGLLAAYYIGVISFLRDHFDIIKSDISLSGISCGTFAAFILFLELSIFESFSYLFMLNSLFAKRRLSCFFLKPKPYFYHWYNKTLSLNKTDNSIKKMYQKYKNNNIIYFGCSTLNNWGLHKILIGHNQTFKTLKELVYAMTLSARTLPFFRSFGKWYDKNWVFDGGFTAPFAISEYDKKNRNIISISPFCNKSIISSNLKDTICPHQQKEIFSMYDIIKPNAKLNEQIERYKIGYLSAAKLYNVKNMINKGLIWNNNQNVIDINHIDEENWNKYIQLRLKENVDEISHHFKNEEDEEEESKSNIIRLYRKRECFFMFSMTLLIEYIHFVM